MRKKLITVTAAAAALTAAGVAVANGVVGGTAAAVATFAASKQSAELNTCTGGDGDTYQISRGRYTGTSTGDSASPFLSGNIVIDVKSVYNVTDRIGWIEGRVKLQRSGDERGSRLHLQGVLTDSDGDPGNGVLVDGFLSGGGHSMSGLLANMTATYIADNQFHSGRLGGGASTHGLAVVRGRPCPPQAKPDDDDDDNGNRARIAVKLIVKGEVEGLSSTAISVKPRDGSATQTCAILAGVSPSVSGIVPKTSTSPGSQVEIGCGIVNSNMTLIKLKKNGSGGGGRDDDD